MICSLVDATNYNVSMSKYLLQSDKVYLYNEGINILVEITQSSKEIYYREKRNEGQLQK